MSEQTETGAFPETDGEAGAYTFGRRTLRRLLIVLALGVSLSAVGAPLFLWLQYRNVHVMSRNGWVRGHVAYVGAPVDGVVADVLVEDGDRVRAGQVMAGLWDGQLQARLLSAQAQLEKASRELEVEPLAIAQERRRLQSLIAEATAEQAAAEAELRAAESRADDAKERHEVQVSLADKGATPRETMRVAEAGRRTAEALVVAASAEWEAAKAALRSANVEYEGLSVREKRLAVLESRVSIARAEVAERAAALEESKILAPDDGWVVRRTVEPGASVEVGDPIVSVWIGDRVWVEAWVDEKELAHVKIGSAAHVTLKPFPDRVFSGVVEVVGAAPDYEVPESDVPQPFHSRMRNTPVFLVRVGLEETGDDVVLVPGLSAVVGIRRDGQPPTDGADSDAGRAARGPPVELLGASEK